MTVSKKFWVFPCASYHAGTKSHVLSGDVMCEYVYVVLANYSCVCMYMHVSGEEGVRVAGESMRSEIGLLWGKKWTETFLDQVPNCRGPVFPGVLPYLVPNASGCITMRHFWLEFISHFSYYFRNSLDQPCFCFWCYMYKRNKNNHNGLHIIKSMWVLKCSVLHKDQSGIKLQHC